MCETTYIYIYINYICIYIYIYMVTHTWLRIHVYFVCVYIIQIEMFVHVVSGITGTSTVMYCNMITVVTVCHSWSIVLAFLNIYVLMHSDRMSETFMFMHYLMFMFLAKGKQLDVPALIPVPFCQVLATDPPIRWGNKISIDGPTMELWQSSGGSQKLKWNLFTLEWLEHLV